MRTKAIQTNPSDAPPVGKHDVPLAEAVVVWVADIAQVPGKCIPLFVPNVARTPKCLSFPEATGPYTAAIASVSSAPAAVAVHIDTRVGRIRRTYI